MVKKCIKWVKYYKDYCVKQAKGLVSQDSTVDYGRELYRSASFGDKCWVVTEFEDEFNVFCEKSKCGTFGRIADKIHMASFNWKESATKFALEMLLVSNGQLKRRDKI